MNDYNFRGITQSDHKPSAQAGFELRYNTNPNLQWYAGVSGESIDFPNNAAAEIDFYAGVRPTFDKLALDFGVWEYYYPGGKCYSVAACALRVRNGGGPVARGWRSSHCYADLNAQPLGGNVVPSERELLRSYAKATYTFNDQWAAGIQEWYSPSVFNSGACGFVHRRQRHLDRSGTWFPNGLGMYVSGDLGYWDLGTSDAFYAVPPSGGAKYTSYADVGCRRRLHLEGAHARSALHTTPT